MFNLYVTVYSVFPPTGHQEQEMRELDFVSCGARVVCDEASGNALLMRVTEAVAPVGEHGGNDERDTSLNNTRTDCCFCASTSPELKVIFCGFSNPRACQNCLMDYISRAARQRASSMYIRLNPDTLSVLCPCKCGVRICDLPIAEDGPAEYGPVEFGPAEYGPVEDGASEDDASANSSIEDDASANSSIEDAPSVAVASPGCVIDLTNDIRETIDLTNDDSTVTSTSMSSATSTSMSSVSSTGSDSTYKCYV